jgi:hypothetical protein
VVCSVLLKGTVTYLGWLLDGVWIGWLDLLHLYAHLVTKSNYCAIDISILYTLYTTSQVRNETVKISSKLRMTGGTKTSIQEISVNTGKFSSVRLPTQCMTCPLKWFRQSILSSKSDPMEHCVMECRLPMCGKGGAGGRVGIIVEVNCNEHKFEGQDWFIRFKRWPLERSTSFFKRCRSDDGRNMMIYW